MTVEHALLKQSKGMHETHLREIGSLNKMARHKHSSPQPPLVISGTPQEQIVQLQEKIIALQKQLDSALSANRRVKKGNMYMSKLGEAHVSAMEKLERIQEKEIDELEKKHEDEFDALTNKHKEQIDELESKQEEEMETLRAKYYSESDSE